MSLKSLRSSNGKEKIIERHCQCDQAKTKGDKGSNVGERNLINTSKASVRQVTIFNALSLIRTNEAFLNLLQPNSWNIQIRLFQMLGHYFTDMNTASYKSKQSNMQDFTLWDAKNYSILQGPKRKKPLAWVPSFSPKITSTLQCCHFFLLLQLKVTYRKMHLA